jgi:VWFA-related protein
MRHISANIGAFVRRFSLFWLALAFIAAWSAGGSQRGVPFNCGPGQRSGCGQAGTTRVDPAEQAAYDAFEKEGEVDTQIALGEEFDEDYPKSRYQEMVDTSLAVLYFNKSDAEKFYAAADRVLATNPNNVPILELVGWSISRKYDAKDPSSPAKLDEAEKYEKRALGLIAAMKKPRQVTQAEFDNSKASLAWRAYSGLGTTYFRLKDFADSAAELQLAIKQESPEPDVGDLYVLGIDLENLDRKTEAADEFAQCSLIVGDMQQQCQQAYEAASHAVAHSAEDDDFNAFTNTAGIDAKIRLGEAFDQKYPASSYGENVDATLVALYNSKEDWNKFYAAANKVLAKDPDNIPVLTLVGWVIPRAYTSDEANAADRLDESEKYEKHALGLIAALPKPADLTEEQFDQAKANTALRAHSGLGVMYFRRGDFDDSEKELEIVTAASRLSAELSPADAFDLYIFGVDLQNLNRARDAADAFTRCGAITGYLQAQCKRDAAAVTEAAQLAAVAAKPATSSGAVPAASDIPPSIAPQSAPAIKAETIVVPVRVVVRDAKGQPVANLKKEDFKLYQDGKLQQVTSFSVNTGSGTAAPSGAGGPAIPQRFVALFFDDVHTKLADLVESRNAAMNYVTALQPDDRVAVATVSGQGEMDFSNDGDKLRQTLVALAPHPVTARGASGARDCPPMDYAEANAIENQQSGQAVVLGIQDTLNCAFSGDSTFAAAAEVKVRAAARNELIATDQEAEAIVERVRELIRRVSVLPGGRNIVFVSPGFIDSGHEAELDEIISGALRYNIVINTLDPEGLATRTLDAASLGAPRPPAQQVYIDGLERSTQMLSQTVLEEISDSTGGVFFHNSNDLSGGFRELAAPADFYYLLGYSPQDLKPDGRYHNLKVSLAGKKDYGIEARRGFYAPSRLETPEEAVRREIQEALFSNDEQHDLPVKLETALTQDASGAQKLDVKADIDPSQLHFNKSAGANQEELTISAALFDNNGNYVAGTQKVDQMNLSDATLAQLSKSGFYIEMGFEVKPGDYVVRLVARDSNDGHISAEDATITVPN